MNNTPLISILTPTFNHEKYVGSFIDSLIAQTYDNWELIIVDDCSTDNNISEIKKYTDLRIKLFQQDFNQGPGAALNRAFSESKGEIIVDMASDDMLYPDYFEYIVKTFSENNDVGVIYSSLDVIDENNKVYEKFDLPNSYTRIDFLRDLFYKDNVLYSPGMSVRRDVYSKIVPMDACMVQHQDYQWHVQFLGQFECVVTDKSYVCYRFIKNNKISLSSVNRGEFNRRRLEIDSLMNSFLDIKDLNVIKNITHSELCNILTPKCSDYIWAQEALKCGNYEKRQWGYKVICKCYNDNIIRTELYHKIGLTFGQFLQFTKENIYFRDKEFEKQQLRSKLSTLYHKIFN